MSEESPNERPGRRGGEAADRRCPLCYSLQVRDLGRAHGRDYLICRGCDLAFMSAAFNLDEAGERRRYELHRNDPGDPGYRAHIEAAIEPLRERLKPGSEGLDFGCGPVPATSLLLAEAGFRPRCYDPLFAPDAGALDRIYDFAVCVEAAEHFREPGRELELLHRLLRPSGLLSIMTLLRPPDPPFERWWYTRDPTHVSFYSKASLEWLERTGAWKLESSSGRVHVLRRCLS